MLLAGLEGVGWGGAQQQEEVVEQGHGVTRFPGAKMGILSFTKFFTRGLLRFTRFLLGLTGTKLLDSFSFWVCALRKRCTPRVCYFQKT